MFVNRPQSAVERSAAMGVALGVRKPSLTKQGPSNGLDYNMVASGSGTSTNA